MNFIALIISLAIVSIIFGFFFLAITNPIVGVYFVIGVICLVSTGSTYHLVKEAIEKNKACN